MPSVYADPFPRIFTHPLENEMDWWRVRNLLIETHAISGPEFNWEIRHWDGNRFHGGGPLWNPALYEKFCLWETEHGQLVGVAHVEGDDEICLQLHPDCRAAIEEEMLAWVKTMPPARTPVAASMCRLACMNMMPRAGACLKNADTRGRAMAGSRAGCTFPTSRCQKPPWLMGIPCAAPTRKTTARYGMTACTWPRC